MLPKAGRNEDAAHSGRSDDPLEGRPAAIRRKGNGAAAGADNAQVGGGEEGTVLGQQTDALAGLGFIPQKGVPAAGGGPKLAVRHAPLAVKNGRSAFVAAGQNRRG